jgi:hypothetical protein
MKYSREEEEQNLNNFSSNTTSARYNYNSNIAQDTKPKEEWIYVNPSIYIMYCLLNGISVVGGCLIKIICPISRSKIGKKSILTGIPIIRNYYFLFPFLLNITYFIWCIWIFYKNTSIRAFYEKNIFKYLKSIRGAFFFTNILLIIVFYVLYNLVILSIYKTFGFKLSGHILASVLSGGMIVNLHNTYEPFIRMKIGPNFNKYISYANMFLYYHSIYTVFWSAWIFHQPTELILAFLISVSSLVLVHVVNADELFLNLIDCNNPRRNPVILYK